MLTREQSEAVCYDGGHLQLIACAGSGKTEVVSRRIARLLDPTRDPRILPHQVVAFTFTERAAGELSERTHARCRSAYGDMMGLADLWIGTMHGYALDLLRSESTRHVGHEVIDEVRLRLLVDRYSRESGLTLSHDLAGRRLRRFVDTDLYIQALGLLREATLHPDLLEDNSVASGLARYQVLLDRLGYLDYSAILAQAAELVETDASVREKLAGRLRHVIVDEYQDTNPVQERLIRALADLGVTLTVVGDDDQTIYQWRGSDVRNILGFAERYTPVHTVRLEDNFRSSPGVIELARTFIERNEDRLPKRMRSADIQWSEDGDLVALDFDSPEDEAAWIARTARDLRGLAFQDGPGKAPRGLAWSDMAVLLRSVRSSAEPILAALADAGVRAVVVGMNQLFARPEAQAAAQLFHFMAGSVEPDALRQAWLDADLGLVPERVDAAVATVRDIRRRVFVEDDEGRFAFYSLHRLFMRFLEQLGLREEVLPEARREPALYNLGRFTQVLSDYEAVHFRTSPLEKYEGFSAFLTNRAGAAYAEGTPDARSANPDAVRVMTVHQAKGLQWPVVFLPALARNRFPVRAGGGRTVWHLLPEAAVAGAERIKGSIEDERRLFYVALSRSQKMVLASWAPRPRSKAPSPFFEYLARAPGVCRTPPDHGRRPRLPPEHRHRVEGQTLTFSALRYFVECPYQYRLRVDFGFNPQVHEALGYGKSLHDMLADVNERLSRGERVPADEAATLVERHLRLPYAYPRLREKLSLAAEATLRRFLSGDPALLASAAHSEEKVMVDLGDALALEGRIDLVRQEGGDDIVVDYKSTSRALPEELVRLQLDIYALGWSQRTGRPPAAVEVHSLDTGHRQVWKIEPDRLARTGERLRRIATDLQRGDFPTRPNRGRCEGCDFSGICTASACGSGA